MTIKNFKAIIPFFHVPRKTIILRQSAAKHPGLKPSLTRPINALELIRTQAPSLIAS